jgi:hypothetical protein
MSRELKPTSLPKGPKATINEKLDEALEESFPASDLVSLGHSEHVGQPKPKRKKDSKLPKDTP